MFMTTNQLANKIIQMFIENDIPPSQQLEILQMAKEKIEWCRKVGSEIENKKTHRRIQTIINRN